LASSVTTVYDWAAELLAVAETALATTSGGVPARSYVTFAVPVLDCPEQLTVDVRMIGNDTVSPQSPRQAQGHLTQYGHLVPVATFTITATRCVPTVGQDGLLPLVTDLQAAARLIDQDGWAIFNTLTQVIQAGSLWGGRCTTIQRLNGVPVAGQGGTAGWTFSLTPMIDGYTP
jgi:hypothetical protein